MCLPIVNWEGEMGRRQPRIRPNILIPVTRLDIVSLRLITVKERKSSSIVARSTKNSRNLQLHDQHTFYQTLHTTSLGTGDKDVLGIN